MLTSNYLLVREHLICEFVFQGIGWKASQNYLVQKKYWLQFTLFWSPETHTSKMTVSTLNISDARRNLCKLYNNLTKIMLCMTFYNNLRWQWAYLGNEYKHKVFRCAIAKAYIFKFHSTVHLEQCLILVTEKCCHGMAPFIISLLSTTSWCRAWWFCNGNKHGLARDERTWCALAITIWCNPTCRATQEDLGKKILVAESMFHA